MSDHHFLIAQFNTKPFTQGLFVDDAEVLNKKLKDKGWRLFAACFAVTGAVHGGTVLHVWKVPDASAHLDPQLAEVVAVLQHCDGFTQRSLLALPYSPVVAHQRQESDNQRVHHFLYAEIPLKEGTVNTFTAKATALIDQVEVYGWRIVAAGVETIGAIDTVINLWELPNADAVLAAMRGFAENSDYQDLLKLCRAQTQHLYSSVFYNPLGANPLNYLKVQPVLMTWTK